ncbi:ribonuclease [uncultured Xylophilus sp.]|uniref:ribonuclease n=1 Tax=uncultured Xylophilus sp. TaxID=296832 RepID=UPI0025E83A50|nr:ribonuclease [uncultured Xylophilus sp.]
MLRKVARGALSLRTAVRAVIAPSAAAGRAGAWALGSALLLALSPAAARSPVPSAPLESATVTVAELPAQGREVFRLIRAGGPFAHDKDGRVFGNRERLLPAQARGYYREYTVDTPGARNRGARRIVCGGEPRRPDRCYYTADHYASFRAIVE